MGVDLLGSPEGDRPYGRLEILKGCGHCCGGREAIPETYGVWVKRGLGDVEPCIWDPIPPLVTSGGKGQWFQMFGWNFEIPGDCLEERCYFCMRPSFLKGLEIQISDHAGGAVVPVVVILDEACCPFLYPFDGLNFSFLVWVPDF